MAKFTYSGLPQVHPVKDGNQPRFMKGTQTKNKRNKKSHSKGGSKAVKRQLKQTESTLRKLEEQVEYLWNHDSHGYYLLRRKGVSFK